MSNLNLSPWAFLYAMIWIPSMIATMWLWYYEFHGEPSPKMRVYKWICTCIVITIPAGLMFAAETCADVLFK